MKRPAVRELEILKMIWEMDDPVTVRDVYEETRKVRRIAYTTIMTEMMIMARKGLLLLRGKQSRANAYSAAYSRKEVELLLVKDLLDRVFDGNVPVMRRRLREAAIDR